MAQDFVSSTMPTTSTVSVWLSRSSAAREPDGRTMTR